MAEDKKDILDSGFIIKQTYSALRKAKLATIFHTRKITHKERSNMHGYYTNAP
jgi:hypothetical protein